MLGLSCACGIFSCSVRTLTCMRPSSLIRKWTPGPLHWECRVLTAGAPETYLWVTFPFFCPYFPHHWHEILTSRIFCILFTYAYRDLFFMKKKFFFFHFQEQTFTPPGVTSPCWEFVSDIIFLWDPVTTMQLCRFHEVPWPPRCA